MGITNRRRRIVDRHADYRRAVLVAGVAKNSTALVCDALIDAGRYRHLFEPFSDLSEPSTGLQNRLVWIEYLSPASRLPDVRRHTAAILTGRVRSPQIDRWTARRYV